MPIAETEVPVVAGLSDSPESLADVLERLGGISPARVCAHPAPGAATVEDLLRLPSQSDRHYELVDGCLVEKPVGYLESRLAARLIFLLMSFVDPRNLGSVLAPDAPFRFGERQVRLPDVAFISRGRESAVDTSCSILNAAPELAVEILSPSNTAAEIARKLREYFQAGVRLVWIVDPRALTVRVHRDAEAFTTLAAADTLDGGDVLPGFVLPLSDLFRD